MAAAVKLTDAYDSNRRRLTAVDALINETIEGDARLAVLAASGSAAERRAWEAVARDLARQVIEAEAERAELDEITENDDRYWKVESERDAAEDRYQDEERAHCATYVEAVRLSEELAGWQDSSHAEYRRSTAAARLAEYRKSTASPVADDVGAGF